MVRINLIDPAKLADQHLIAEYNESLMLIGYVRKFPAKKDIPISYTLGKGHIKFFKNKLAYIRDRHESIKKEMIKRRFKPTKKIDLTGFDSELCQTWKPCAEDIALIKSRLREKIKKKPKWYRYYGKPQTLDFFIRLLE